MTALRHSARQTWSTVKRLAESVLAVGMLGISTPVFATPFPARPGPVPAEVSLEFQPARVDASRAGLPELTRELHSVRDPFVRKWQRATAHSMAGPGASVWYRDMATQLDVRWRLAEMNPTPVHLDNAIRDLALDMSIAGATSGWDAAIRRTLRQSTELTPLHTLARSVFTPSLQVQRARDGSATLKPDSAASLDGRAAMADIDRGTANVGPAVRPTSPTLRTGSSFTFISIPTSDDVRAGAEADSPVSPGMTSWIDVRDVVFDAARIQARVAQDPTRRRFDPNVRWTALARQEIIPAWAVIADFQGQMANKAVHQRVAVRQGVALEHRLTGFGRSAWAVRTGMARQLRDDLGPDILEDRFTVSLRADLGWYVPQDVDRWPLGHRPGAPGPVLPVLPPTGPGQPEPFIASPAERTGAEPPPPMFVAAR